jgi:hypothetical protein
MANITPTVTRSTDGGVNNVYLATWTALGNADVGTQVAMSGASDRSVQIEGTFGGATVAVQGSNDGTNWQTLTDPQGNAISTTAAKLEQISELTRFIRVITTGGTGTNVNVNLLLKGQF